MTSAALVVARAAHIGSAMLLFGELLFVLAVAGAARRRTGDAARDRTGSLERRLHVVVIGCIVVSALSGALWLAAEVAAMTGTSIDRSLDPDAIARVLRETEFGRVWLLRGVALAILAAAALSLRHATGEAQRRLRAMAALALGAAYLAMLAWAGHAAAATEGAWHALHAASDVAHLLAAGAWLGALPPLVSCLRKEPSIEALSRQTQRFSRLAIASVAVLLASGIVNAWFLVGSLPALLGTAYGRLLVAKLAVFAAMLVAAATNRWRLTPRLAHGDAVARRALRRNATLEIAGGGAIVVIVGVLGTMVPAAHQSPVWPFRFTLAPSLAGATDGARLVLFASAGLALAGAIAIIGGARRNAARRAAPGIAALLLAASASAWVLAVPAFPTTYAASPVPYAADAIARGAARYAAECSGCHGAAGHGDGPLAASLPRRPADLVAHGSRHPQGNLFWWISHGIPDTAMPAFAPRLADVRIWELVQFLAALSGAERATSISPNAVPASGVGVPDFAYELPGQTQQTLLGQHAPALIVLYSLPQSLPRLAELASDHRLAHAGLRVVAVARAPGAGADSTNPLPPAVTTAGVASVYAMFARAPDGTAPAHAELLVDAPGLLRARWLGVPDAASDRTSAVIAETKRLADTRTSVAPPSHRGH